MIGKPVVLIPVAVSVDDAYVNENFAAGLAGWATTGGTWAADATNGARVVSAAANALVKLYASEPPWKSPEMTSYTTHAVGSIPLPGVVYVGWVYRTPAGVLSTGSIAVHNMPTAGPFDFTDTTNVSRFDGKTTLGPYVGYGVTGAGNRPNGFTITRLEGSYAADATDLTCLADQVAIRYGRDDDTGQPEASTATLDLSWWAGDPAAMVIPNLDIGAPLLVLIDWADKRRPRFYGRVTDLSTGWDDADEETPDRPMVQVVAAGVLADLGRLVVGDVPWPQENDSARVKRILTAAGVYPDLAYIDPGTVKILPRDVDSQPALGLLHGVADSASGVIWETFHNDDIYTEPRVAYADARHRQSQPVALNLDACNILVTPVWRRDLSGLINKVSLGYGPTPDQGEQPRYLAQNDESIAAHGTYDYSFTTELATLADAENMGDLALIRNAWPAWNLATLPVDVAGLDTPQTTALLDLTMHEIVNVTGLPAAGTVPTSELLWVEGWQETLADGRHALELAVSDYARTAGIPEWDAWGEGTWDETDPAVTWDSVRYVQPPVDRGRWNDVPASTTWLTLFTTGDHNTTWDTWK